MNLTFFTSLPGFIGPLAKHFGEQEGHEVKIFVNGDKNTFMGTLQTCEVAWFDFANEMLIAAQNMYKHNTFKTVVRLHSYEAFTPMPEKIDWSRVDDLILVNESVKGILEMHGMWKRIADNTRVHIVPNLVDTEKFAFTPEKDFTKIGYLGHINYKKDPCMIIPISEAVEEQVIHVAGEFQDLRYQTIFDQYFKNVVDPGIVMDGYQKDVNKWLKDKGFILNTSLFESFNYALCEGILTGSIPLIRNWLGSDNIYPEFPKWNTVGECVQIIHDFMRMGEDEFLETQKGNRQFVIDNYDVKVLTPKIEEILYANNGRG